MCSGMSTRRRVEHNSDSNRGHCSSPCSSGSLKAHYSDRPCHEDLSRCRLRAASRRGASTRLRAAQIHQGRRRHDPWWWSGIRGRCYGQGDRQRPEAPRGVKRQILWFELGPRLLRRRSVHQGLLCGQATRLLQPAASRCADHGCRLNRHFKRHGRRANGRDQCGRSQSTMSFTSLVPM